MDNQPEHYSDASNLQKQPTSKKSDAPSKGGPVRLRRSSLPQNAKPYDRNRSNNASQRKRNDPDGEYSLLHKLKKVIKNPFGWLTKPASESIAEENAPDNDPHSNGTASNDAMDTDQDAAVEVERSSKNNADVGVNGTVKQQPPPRRKQPTESLYAPSPQPARSRKTLHLDSGAAAPGRHIRANGLNAPLGSRQSSQILPKQRNAVEKSAHERMIDNVAAIPMPIGKKNSSGRFEPTNAGSDDDMADSRGSGSHSHNEFNARMSEFFLRKGDAPLTEAERLQVMESVTFASRLNRNAESAPFEPSPFQDSQSPFVNRKRTLPVSPPSQSPYGRLGSNGPIYPSLVSSNGRFGNLGASEYGHEGSPFKRRQFDYANQDEEKWRASQMFGGSGRAFEQRDTFNAATAERLVNTLQKERTPQTEARKGSPMMYARRGIQIADLGRSRRRQPPLDRMGGFPSASPVASRTKQVRPAPYSKDRLAPRKLPDANIAARRDSTVSAASGDMMDEADSPQISQKYTSVGSTSKSVPKKSGQSPVSKANFSFKAPNKSSKSADATMEQSPPPAAPMTLNVKPTPSYKIDLAEPLAASKPNESAMEEDAPASLKRSSLKAKITPRGPKKDRRTFSALEEDLELDEETVERESQLSKIPAMPINPGAFKIPALPGSTALKTTSAATPAFTAIGASSTFSTTPKGPPPKSLFPSLAETTQAEKPSQPRAFSFPSASPLSSTTSAATSSTTSASTPAAPAVASLPKPFAGFKFPTTPSVSTATATTSSTSAPSITPAKSDTSKSPFSFSAIAPASSSASLPSTTATSSLFGSLSKVNPKPADDSSAEKSTAPATKTIPTFNFGTAASTPSTSLAVPPSLAPASKESSSASPFNVSGPPAFGGFNFGATKKPETEKSQDAAIAQSSVNALTSSAAGSEPSVATNISAAAPLTFNFGGAKTSDATTSSATPAPAVKFAFGGSSSTTNPSPFNFGGSIATSKPSEIASDASAPPKPFGFGGTGTAATPTPATSAPEVSKPAPFAFSNTASTAAFQPPQVSAPKIPSLNFGFSATPAVSAPSPFAPAATSSSTTATSALASGFKFNQPPAVNSPSLSSAPTIGGFGAASPFGAPASTAATSAATSAPSNATFPSFTAAAADKPPTLTFGQSNTNSTATSSAASPAVGFASLSSPKPPTFGVTPTATTNAFGAPASSTFGGFTGFNKQPEVSSSTSTAFGAPSAAPSSGFKPLSTTTFGAQPSTSINFGGQSSTPSGLGAAGFGANATSGFGRQAATNTGFGGAMSAATPPTANFGAGGSNASSNANLNSAPQAPSTSPAPFGSSTFSFGSQPSGPSASFQFGSSTAPTNSTNFVFGQQPLPSNNNSADNLNNLNNNNNAAAPAANSFNFGQQQQPQTNNPNPFAFGAQQNNNTMGGGGGMGAAGASATPFQFGAPPPATPAPASPMFSMGTATKRTDGRPVARPKSKRR